MFIIHDSSDYGMTGFFLDWPNGTFTILRGGGGWVASHLVGGVWADCFDTLDTRDVAHSALIQGF